MALNRATVGKHYDPGPPFDVSRQKIREFALAIGDHSSIYSDIDCARAAGHRDLPAPPTFGYIPAYLMGQTPQSDPEVGIDRSRIVFGEQHISLTRPIYAGDVLAGEVMIADIRDAGSNEILEILCVLTDADGHEVCRITSILVSRGTAVGTANV